MAEITEKEIYKILTGVGVNMVGEMLSIGNNLTGKPFTDRAADAIVDALQDAKKGGFLRSPIDIQGKIRFLLDELNGMLDKDSRLPGSSLHQLSYYGAENLELLRYPLKSIFKNGSSRNQRQQIANYLYDLVSKMDSHGREQVLYPILREKIPNGQMLTQIIDQCDNKEDVIYRLLSRVSQTIRNGESWKSFGGEYVAALVKDDRVFDPIMSVFLHSELKMDKKQAQDLSATMRQVLSKDPHLADSFNQIISSGGNQTSVKAQIAGLLSRANANASDEESKKIFDAVATLYPEAGDAIKFIGGLKNRRQIFDSVLSTIIKNPNIFQAIRSIGSGNGLKDAKGIPTKEEVATLLRTINENIEPDERKQLFALFGKTVVPKEMRLALETMPATDQKKFIDMLAGIIENHNGGLLDTKSYPGEFIQSFSKQDFSKALIATLISQYSQRGIRGIPSFNRQEAMDFVEARCTHHGSLKGFLSALLLDEVGNLRLDENGNLNLNRNELLNSALDVGIVKLKHLFTENGGRKVERLKTDDGKVLVAGIRGRLGPRS